MSDAPELNDRTGELAVHPPSPGNHGPVRVANTYHFAYADGTPHRDLGTTCYAWLWQEAALQEETLRTLATAPFNKVRFCVFPKRYAWNTNEPPLYPFPGDAKSKDWDFSRFNPACFQHLERRVLDLQKLGIEADLILFHPYDRGHWGFDRMPSDVDDRYLRYVVARLAAYRNVWWSLANEWDFMERKRESDFVRFGELVAREDPYHHLLSIHNGSLLFNHTLPFITHASIQNGAAVEDPGRAELYRDAYRKPVVYDEVKYEGDIDNRWGRLSAEELVFRFWNGTVAGAYVGHGETYRSDDQVLWWSKGGRLKGQSPARLAFLKRVLDEAPAAGIEPIDRWQHSEYGGRAPDYYLVYLGKLTPRAWEFRLPMPPQGKGQRPVEGMRFAAEVLDTWDMTITPVEGSFTLRRLDSYTCVDREGRQITLPGKPYQAIRIRRVPDPAPTNSAGSVGAGAKAIPRTDRNSQIAHGELLRKAAQGGIDVYFEGDSITRRWGSSDAQYRRLLENWRTNFFGWNVADFGWGGDTVQNILWRLEEGELDGVHPKAIVLLAGTNNLGGRRTPGDEESKVEEIVGGIQAILARMREKAPGAAIVLMGITPRNDGGHGAETWGVIQRVNRRLAQMADGNAIRYLGPERPARESRWAPGARHDSGRSAPLAEGLSSVGRRLEAGLHRTPRAARLDRPRSAPNRGSERLEVDRPSAVAWECEVASRGWGILLECHPCRAGGGWRARRWQASMNEAVCGVAPRRQRGEPHLPA